MKLTVNGEAREAQEDASVADLLAQLELGPGPVAVEVNRTLVPRARHAEHRLADGDCIEVVTFVGGG